MTADTPAALPTILTQSQLADLLQISPRTLEDWRLTHSGPPYRRLGRHVRYELGAVMRWFEDQDSHA